MDAEAIARKSMRIAGDLCVYTNNSNIIEVMEKKDLSK
jgi:ATP-dependent protease HslVU (ClpYQ) peptidase subunit